MGSTEIQHGDRYLLGRGGMAAARLNFQHHALIRRLGWLLHPSIKTAVDKSENLRVAELAAGTGIWAFDLAREYPEAEIIGLDISAEQFPVRSTWPTNVQLEQHNLFDPVPAKYERYFDLIHIRLLVAGIYHLNRDILMKNIISMMKPGGVIQWEDLTELTCLTVNDGQIISREPPPMVIKMMDVADFSEAVKWAAQLPAIYENFGLEHAVGYDPPIILSAVPMETESLFWSIKEAIETAIAAGKSDAQRDLAEVIKSSEAIFAKGHLWGYPLGIAMARKPIEC